MHYEEILPRASLAPYIRCIWVLEGCGTGAAEEMIFPDGRMELIFHYGAPFMRIISDSGAYVQARASVVGQISSAVRLKPTGAIGMIGVRFHPWGAYSFFGESTAELQDLDLSLDTLWKAPVRELEERVAAAGRTKAISLVQDFLERMKSKDHDRVADLRKLIRSLSRHQGNIPVDVLADQSNLSIRQFNRVFSGIVGLSPKKFAGITRFQHFMKTIRVSKETSLGTLAHRCGYYDQSHFIREFRQYAGLSPKEYFSGHPGISSFFISD